MDTAYSILELPDELCTPMLTTVGIAGWNAHRMEEIIKQNHKTGL